MFTRYAPIFIEATGVTLSLTAVALVFAGILGAGVAAMSMSGVAPLKWLAAAFIGLIRGTPLIAQLFLLYFGLSSIVVLDKFWAGAIALGVHNSAYIAEIIRSGFLSVPKGLVEAARSLGMSRERTLRRVQAPLAFRTILPVLGSQFIIAVKDFRDWTGLSEGLALRGTQVLSLVTAFITMAWLFWFLNRTRSGKAMRAFADNEDLALLSGIDPERVVRLTWIIAAALMTVAGVLYGLDKSFRPFNYFQILLPIFAAAIVGGLGNPIGAIAGGFLVAFSEVAVTYPWKKIAGYLVPGWQPEGLLQLLSTEYKFAVSFVILIVVLLFRPTGLFRGKSF